MPVSVINEISRRLEGTPLHGVVKKLAAPFYAGAKQAMPSTQRRMEAMAGVNQPITGEYDATLAAVCDNGVFVGERQGTVRVFKGIPYAQPPVGALRWKEPQPPPPSQQVRQAKYFGPSPLQTSWFSEVASYYPQSEDCLMLNVWTSEANGSVKKPVMVFFHGGSYAWGGTSDPLYDGHALVEKFDDVVLVTVGYRTGMMGFIDLSSLPGSEGYEASGNLGLLDQLEALRWVQRNIAAFGGDADNVTIFGESAGGGSVSLLPLMKGARGLFRRVIAESGSVALTYSREDCQPLTEKLLQVTGAGTVQDLLDLNWDQLVRANEKVNELGNFPMRDGNILPEDLYAAYEAGEGSWAELLIGTNADESRYWIREAGGMTAYRAMMPVMFENNVARLAERDKLAVEKFLAMQGGGLWAKQEFYDELLFRLPAVRQAAAHQARGGKTYMYYWTYPSSIGVMGACHAVELAYVFGNLNETIYTGDNVDPDLADTVQRMWVSFARTGDPSLPDLPWPQYDAQHRRTMLLGADVKVEEKPLEAQRKLLEPLTDYHFNGCYANLDYNVPAVRRQVKFLVGAVAVGAGVGLLLAHHRKKKA